MLTVAAVVEYLRGFAPLELAEEWDNVGLLLGDASAEVSRLMTCLTVTPASAAEAIVEKAELIVTHHPILFQPTQRITADQPQGKTLLELAKAGVAVYSPHTAFDNAKGGINDILARRLGLGDVQPLRTALSHSPPSQGGVRGVQLCKIVVFVPEKDLGKVSDALFDAGAGVIGEYTQCSFRLAGTGTFFGSEQAKPTIGQKGRREEVSEWRLEVVCPTSRVPAALRAMRGAHSYEEPAFDVYPLRSFAGVGRLGLLPKGESLKAFARRVQQALKATHVQVIGSGGQRVRRVAIACGAGGELLYDAVRARADVFLTGELRFHDQLAAEASGLTVVLPGHYATERPGVEELAEMLGKHFSAVRSWASKREAEPTWSV